MTREICKLCWRPIAIGFTVPDEVWEQVRHPAMLGDTMCLSCFVAMADEKLIEWDREIKFWPVSLRTLHSEPT
jgi:hypothetical protein